MPKVKTRRSWQIKPVQKPHSTKKGKKGYSRRSEKEKMKEVIKETYAK
jgi:hypothetical protein